MPNDYTTKTDDELQDEYLALSAPEQTAEDAYERRLAILDEIKRRGEPQRKLDGAKRLLSYNLREVYDDDEWAKEMSKPAEEIYAWIERLGPVWSESEQRWIDKQREDIIKELKQEHGSGWASAYWDEH